IPGRDRGDVVASWATGVSYARILNTHQRHGDALKIATAADFCGTRWQNNAVIIPTPKGNNRAYLQPVARVMQLYRHHAGSHAIKVGRAPDGLDVVASRRGNTVFLHVANTQRTRSASATLQIDGHVIRSGRVFEISADPTVESVPTGRDDWKPHAKSMPLGRLAGLVASMPSWVSLIIDQDELDLTPAPGRGQYQQPSTDKLVEALDQHVVKARESLSKTNDN